MPTPWRLLIGCAAAGLVAALAWRGKALDRPGAGAAVVVGGLTYGLAGWAGALPLLAFFLTSTLLGRLPGRPRHGPRDARQVMANGGAAALAAIWWAAAHTPTALAALAGALAAANADTWATEWGTRLGGRPRRLLIGAVVPTGASGGMSTVGTLSGAAGAAVVATVAALASPLGPGGMPAVFVGGVAGLLADSLLGATLQARFRCPRCGALLEEPMHQACGGVRIASVGGLRWLDNDGVNAAATIAGAAVGALLLAAHP